MRDVAQDQADVIAVSSTDRRDITYGGDPDVEKAYVQFVSGDIFDALGLRPSLGRLFSEKDDVKPEGHPYAVLSHDYWTRRFAADAQVIGRNFRMGTNVYEIVGISDPRFTGTEPGRIVDIFVPSMMEPAATRSDSSWLRILLLVRPGVAVQPLRDKLNATFQNFQQERVNSITGVPRERLAFLLNQTLLLEPAAAGASGMQRSYRTALISLGAMVSLVLLIACAHVANLMTARAASRAREMALRVSLGAGKARLVQLVLVESSWLAVLAALVGGVFAWRAAPYVVSLINPPDDPARLMLAADWRAAAFGVALTFAVVVLFGLSPALRASSVAPVTALKGGSDPHASRRSTHVLIGVQAAFCFVVLFVGGLFVATYDRLVNQPVGFQTDRVLTLSTVAAQPQQVAHWENVANHLRSQPGVEAAALSDRPLLDGSGWNTHIWVGGVAVSPALAYLRAVSPGWRETMQIPLLDGRDFQSTDVHPGAAIVNETFARTYFPGQNLPGRSFSRGPGEPAITIVGLVRDARYRSMREPILPVAYFPFRETDQAGAVRKGSEVTFVVRTAGADPLMLAPVLRAEVLRSRPEFRVSSIRTPSELVRSHTIRERLLAILAAFFACISMLLTAVGLYAVLNQIVIGQRREIAIRMALGAHAIRVVRRVTTSVFATVAAGALAGAAFGLTAARLIQSLLYEVTSTDPLTFVLPSLALISAASVAAIPAVIRAVRTDPAGVLRGD